MSTRSSIAVVHADGFVSAVYCHFDGYLEGVGAELIALHNDHAKATALVALGDLSAVCRNVIAYSRDRGEDFEQVRPHTYESTELYFANVGADICDNGYRYLFRDGAWWVWSQRESPRPVREALAESKAAESEERE